MGLALYVSEHWLDWVNGGIAGVVVWIASSILGGPLVTFWSDRRTALEVVQEHGSVGYLAADDRIREAKEALRSAASKMGYYAAGGPLIVRVYCWFLCYDLPYAMRALNGLHDLIGEGPADQQANNQDVVRLLLGAIRLLTAERRKELRGMLRGAGASR